MAKFITNSTSDKAIRLSDISVLEIRPSHSIEGGSSTNYELVARLNNDAVRHVIFETGVTIEAVQALAAPIMAALEE